VDLRNSIELGKAEGRKFLEEPLLDYRMKDGSKVSRLSRLFFKGDHGKKGDASIYKRVWEQRVD